jgi:polyferredoxin
VSTDVLRWPAIGRLLRWRHARKTFQLLLLGIAAIVIVDGIFGPQTPTSNLAPVLTWVHYRGLLIIALLAAGNLFCMGCPFVLVRDAGRRFLPPAFRWPRRMRTKWVALGLFVLVLFTYELFDLWALPRATAYLVLGYFGAALVVDLSFSGATFCKYLCPIGQFNFVASTMSPLQLHIKTESTCRSCRTADCIKGRRQPDAPQVVVQRGCELGLFLPLKVGNMDCTFCLDCVQACPHDNVALTSRLPGLELADTHRRSGVGWLSRRPDIAGLAVLFAFGGMLNAFAMVAPVYRLETWTAHAIGVSSEVPVLALLFVMSLGVAPMVFVGGAAALTRLIVGDTTGSLRDTAVNYAYALVPFGVGMWTAHYGFHLLTALLTVIPITQNIVNSLVGWTVLGEPFWRWTGMRPGSVFPIQMGCILLGAMGSLALAYRISDRDYPESPGPPTAPWACVTVALASIAIWILSQPMEMRAGGFLG